MHSPRIWIPAIIADQRRVGAVHLIADVLEVRLPVAHELPVYAGEVVTQKTVWVGSLRSSN